MDYESIDTRSTGEGAAGSLTSDSDGLMPLGLGPFGVGSVPEVNGVQALEAREFVPTRLELSIIAQHWVKVVLQLDFEFFCFPIPGAEEWQMVTFARRRLSRIEQILGADFMKELERNVMSELEAKVDPQLWKKFANGEGPPRNAYGIPVLPGV